MDRPLRCSRRDRLDQSPCNGIVDDGGGLARDIGLKILQDALEASEPGFVSSVFSCYTETGI